MPAVSAPGKVLLAGGYLVLDRDFTGLVFGLSARIHVHIQPLETSSGVALEEIIVRSPQFLDASWEYGYRISERGGGIEVNQLRSSAHNPLRRNPFIETTLTYALTYISTVASPVIQPASVTILADDEYYTQAGPIQTTAPAAAADDGRFRHFGVALDKAHKTGLGSSAALVTALTAALLVHYLPKDAISLTSDEGRAKLHNLAQIAHCAAQGKVGSGFDVAAAVYGSCLYRRFSPELLEANGAPGAPDFAARLKALVEEADEQHRWDTEVLKAKVKMPAGIRLIMCDVDCGSQTPGMVKQVLAWRAREPDEADMLWRQLHRRNEALAAELTRLAESGSAAQDHGPLKQCITEIRVLIREMSRLSGVPIEPEPQTELLDACSAVEGIIGGVVPGAGGFDAIALLVEDRAEVLTKLAGLLESWRVPAVREKEDDDAQAPGGERAAAVPAESIGKVSMLMNVREDMEGVHIEEDLSAYGMKPWTRQQ